MVIGDSFTASYFPPMLAQHVGRAIWLNHRECGFDWNWIDKLQPDEVWWMPTERFLICDEGVRPLNFAGSGEDHVLSSAGHPRIRVDCAGIDHDRQRVCAWLDRIGSAHCVAPATVLRPHDRALRGPPPRFAGGQARGFGGTLRAAEPPSLRSRKNLRAPRIETNPLLRGT